MNVIKTHHLVFRIVLFDLIKSVPRSFGLSFSGSFKNLPEDVTKKDLAIKLRRINKTIHNQFLNLASRWGFNINNAATTRAPEDTIIAVAKLPVLSMTSPAK